jgi:hypothetical protein
VIPPREPADAVSHVLLRPFIENYRRCEVSSEEVRLRKLFRVEIVANIDRICPAF